MPHTIQPCLGTPMTQSCTGAQGVFSIWSSEPLAGHTRAGRWLTDPTSAEVDSSSRLQVCKQYLLWGRKHKQNLLWDPSSPTDKQARHLPGQDVLWQPSGLRPCLTSNWGSPQPTSKGGFKGMLCYTPHDRHPKQQEVNETNLCASDVSMPQGWR